MGAAIQRGCPGQDYRPVTRDSCSSAVQDFALAALNVSLQEPHACQAEFVEGADLDVIGLDVSKL
jgi:hypothetical protein